MLLLAAGCASASVARYPGVVYPPNKLANVIVYRNYPPVPYQVIGEVNYTASSSDAEWPSPEDMLRSKAAKIGGDAVVIQVEDRPYESSEIHAGTFESATDKTAHGDHSRYNLQLPSVTDHYGHVFRGVVIKFLPPSATSVSVPASSIAVSTASASTPAVKKVLVCPVCHNRWAIETHLQVCPFDGTVLQVE